MSNVMTRGSFPSHMKELITKSYDVDRKTHPNLYKEIFKEIKSNDAYEEYNNHNELGPAQVRYEGANTAYDAARELFRHSVKNVTYSLGIQVTPELIADGKAIPFLQRKAPAFAKAEADVKERLAANILNRAFNSSYTFADGKELCATDHPSDVGSQSNELSTPADLSEASLEQFTIDIKKSKDHRGLRELIIPKRLVIAPDEMHNAKRILGSDLRVATADNDLNALKAGGYFTEAPIVNPYLTDADAYFILTDKNDMPGEGLIYQNRQEVKFSEDTRFDSDVMAMKMVFRCAFSANNWRAIWGTPGAA